MERFTDSALAKALSKADPTDQHNQCYIRLAELEDKLEDGQALELPFKVGDRVFLVRRNRSCKLVVSRTKIEMYCYHWRLLAKCSCDSSWHEPQNIFSDKNQAEDRLKEIKERGQ